MDINDLPSFKELKENPLHLLRLVNQYVEVKLIQNTTLFGFVHSIDPESLSMILLETQEDKVKTVLIPGHAILDLCVTEPKSNIIIPIKQTTNPNSEQDSITRRKIQVFSWLKENLIPVTEELDNIVIGNVTILPPYKLTDVSTDNPIVSMRILSILDKMPENYWPKKF